MSSLIAPAEVRPLTPREFEQIRQLAYEKAGLDLRDGKESLVQARLGKKMRELRFSSFQEYFRHVREDSTGGALTELIDSLTTNHTNFFREPQHFDFLRRTVMPGLRHRDRIPIWCAAASTGEEPYTIAFSVLDELGPDALSRLRILATDISTRVLATAQQGLYAEQRFEGIPDRQVRPYLLRGKDRYAGWYRVKPDVRATIEFRQLNLIESFSHLGAFPVIFCRNVMIYFDRPTQQDVVNRMTSCLEPGGYLMIGHSESLNGLDHQLQYVQPATYRKPGNLDSRGPVKR